MFFPKILVALTTLSLAVSLSNAAPVPRQGEPDVVPLEPRALDVAASTVRFLDEVVRIPGLPENPIMSAAAVRAHEPLNAAGIISADGSKILRWPTPAEEGLTRNAATYFRAMAVRYPSMRITQWPDYIAELFRRENL